jgi:hypothetical protein
MKRVIAFIFTIGVTITSAQESWKGKFEQLGTNLPTPNSYRTASGAPGPKYWQQRADYVLRAEVDDEKQTLTGSGTITYYNNSPETLTYLWLQLDQNVNADNSLMFQTTTNAIRDSVPSKLLSEQLNIYPFKGGITVSDVRDENGNPLSFIINQTMMRIDLNKPLKTGQSVSFSQRWFYNINDRNIVENRADRSGMEYFPEDGNYLYTIAQWYPRMCVFDDYEGWQNKQYLGAGEFALAFGNFDVKITVPSDHIVGATGWLQNPTEVLTTKQFTLFEQAMTSFEKPVLIVSESEAISKEKQRSGRKSTWHFKAENVRDFAFAHSRKFIWDAQAVKIADKVVLAQSLYPKEGNPLWEQESTRAIKNTLEIYSERTIDYPYPTAYSVHTAEQGMEYPMICFNYGRPPRSKKVDQKLKEKMVGVIIHEVGHNYFPMIVNSDERQWTWMDEGLNTFLENETRRNRYPDFDFMVDMPKGQIPFMKGDKNVMRPIMASSDNQGASFSPNGYSKTGAALTLLRETIMGPELFDKAFKEYAQRWAFKHPNPADFFRTMEDASAVDLDWFWRGWFYSTDHVDVSLDAVKWYKVKKTVTDPERKNISIKQTGMEKSSSGNLDFSKGPTEFNVLNSTDKDYREFLNRIDEPAFMTNLENKNLYELTFKNIGGLISPIIIEWTFKDGSKELEKIPAEIWRTNEQEVKKVFVKEKEVIRIVIDPKEETADINTQDNAFPRKAAVNKFDQFKSKR